jgi:hypothetical protein
MVVFYQLPGSLKIPRTQLLVQAGGQLIAVDIRAKKVQPPLDHQRDADNAQQHQDPHHPLGPYVRQLKKQRG